MRRGRAETVYLIATGGMKLAEAIMFTTYAIYYVKMLKLNPLQLILVGTALETTVMLLEVPTGVVAAGGTLCRGGRGRDGVRPGLDLRQRRL